MARISLTKTQRATDAGKALIALIAEITEDGQLGDSEVHRLKAWLEANSVDGIPAFAWLRAVVEQILADGKVTPWERDEALRAFERVLPVEERELAKLRRRAATEAAAASAAQRPWQDDPATEKQLSFLRSLGVNFSEPISKGQASGLIDKRLDEVEVERQQRARLTVDQSPIAHAAPSRPSRYQTQEQSARFGCAPLLLVPLLAAVALASSSCLGIHQGSTQKVSFESSPPGARVSLHGKTGITPCTLDIPRDSKPHVLRFEARGHETLQQELASTPLELRDAPWWALPVIVVEGVTIIPGVIELFMLTRFNDWPESVIATLPPAGQGSPLLAVRRRNVRD